MAGRPRKEIDEEQVRQLASIGCTHTEIAAVLGCCARTLERNFVNAIKEGQERLKTSLRRWQYESAKSGNVTMQIWLGKQYLGQTEKVASQLSGSNDEPLTIKVKYDK